MVVIRHWVLAPVADQRTSMMMINGYPLAAIFQLGECQLLESLGCTCQSDGLNSALSPVVYGDIVQSINTQ